MAINIKRWLFPFAVAGDKTPIPEAVDPAGAVSYPQGWGPDYERDPATDPLAKRVPRLESNQAMYDVTATLKDLQEQGLSWFIAAAQNEGVAFPYIKGARVLYDNAGDVGVYESLVDSNTAVPTDASKWVRDVAARFATQVETGDGARGDVMIAPRELSRAVQRGAWNYAAAGGTANALTVTLNPAPANNAALIGAPVHIKLAANATADATLAVNGLAALPLTYPVGGNLKYQQLRAGAIITVISDGTRYQVVSGAAVSQGDIAFLTTTGSFVVPDGVYELFVECVGAGGGGGGTGSANTGGGGGGGGGYCMGIIQVTPGQVIPYTIGNGGAGSSSNGATGGSTSFGSFFTANGGGGGASFASSPYGGIGGSGAGGYVISGCYGTDGGWDTRVGGNGGAPGGIGGGAGRGGNGLGISAISYGAGGGGAYTGVNGVVNGGNGGPGAIIIRLVR